MRRKTAAFLSFTLVELAVSIAVLSILILAAFTFLSSTQSVWSITSSKQEILENARIAIDLIARDLESAIYYEGKAPFWHWKPSGSLPSGYSQYRNGHLAFISQTPIMPNDECTLPYCEVKYHLYFASSHDENEGWIRRSVTGNKLSNKSDNPRYNWLPNGVANLTGSLNLAASAFTANSNSSDDYQKLIPYVLDLSFTCDTDIDTGAVIQPDTTTVTEGAVKNLTYGATNKFPSSITISITLMDKNSWEKWLILCGNSVYNASDTSAEPASARSFRENHQITFNRMVYLGDRGQE